MKFILKILVLLTTTVALFFVIALFVDGSFKAEKSKTIPVNNQLAFDYILDLKNQKDYGAWFELDPKMKIWYIGTPGQVGYKVCWKSKNAKVGSGEQEIIKIENGERVDFKLRLFEPESMEGDISVKTSPLDKTKTKITFSIHGEVKYPWNIMMLFHDTDKQVGQKLAKGLSNLAPILKKKNLEE